MTHTESNHPSTARSANRAQEVADGGPELDDGDREAMRRLAQRAGLIPARKKPHGDGAVSRSQGPTSAKVWEIADLLVGDGLTLPLHVLAVIADARATWQDDKGGKSAASQYRHCAHHLRQAADILVGADDATDEERAATANLASAYVEAAATHAREAALPAS
ncbi:hypothetical protein OG613_47415 (plasmid) [Streptomyces sp. NBC_00015]|uniref:hypothetical protein n=1 Tax=Streptomyces sp. NBC_00015 TaxID=2903611 RepID=UPI002F9183F3